jgi:hypothetical protein
LAGGPRKITRLACLAACGPQNLRTIAAPLCPGIVLDPVAGLACLESIFIAPIPTRQIWAAITLRALRRASH